jgi:hypothetical protein
LITATTLNNRSFKDLAQMAKRHGVDGWHTMRKEQLVAAIVRSSQRNNAQRNNAQRNSAQRKAAKNGQAHKAAPRRRSAGVSARTGAAVRTAASGRTGASLKTGVNGSVKGQTLARRATRNGAAAKAKSRFVAKRLEQAKAKVLRSKSLATAMPAASPATAVKPAKNHAPINGAAKASIRTRGKAKDRLVVMVRGPFWLHAYWDLTRQGVERAQSALGQEWHAAKPILRLLEVPAGATTTSAESPLRDIEIHGGVNNWYVDVTDPPKSYRLDIGYLAASGKFYVLARSNVVSTPKAGANDAIDENWSEVAEDFDKIYAMSGGYAVAGRSVDLQELFEERLRRPMGSPLVTRYGAGIEGLLPNKRPFHFDVDAELLVFGSTEPDAHVTLQGEPVKLRPDGTFTVRFNLPNCRQVIPAVSCSRDGFEQRTVVLAIERNTKTMEPLIRDGSEV